MTGAAGSIGSELCRQILQHGPSLLVLLDWNENGMFRIGNELAIGRGATELVTAVGSVTDRKRVDELFARHRPELVFHAAAHKHVPMMEFNPCEAVKNNVGGMRTLADAAHRSGAKRFILISSDKAVNPTSVMGATKRVCEMVVRAMANGSETRFAAVRFGNVLGSNGSVVPYFLEQIRQGGPVTVTHPGMRRYFMLISEAVQLVLHAAAMAEPQSLYVLEMGERMSVLELARNVIRLSGHVLDEIPITFTGLRPGEKLQEELVGGEERTVRTAVNEIVRVSSPDLPDATSFFETLEALEVKASAGESAALVEILRRLIPSFKHAQEQPLLADGPSNGDREFTNDRGNGQVSSAADPKEVVPHYGQPDLPLSPVPLRKR